MSSVAGSRAVPASVGGVSAIERVKAYFFSDSRRSIQTVLGSIWVLDGALQFQSFMYGKGFIQFLTNLTGVSPGGSPAASTRVLPRWSPIRRSSTRGPR